MAGTPTNVQLWQNADVYTAPTGTLAPINVVQAYTATWSAVGLIDGDEGITTSQEQETNEFWAWGGLLVKRSRGKHKRTVKFLALEENATVFGLVNPGTAAPGAAVAGLVTRPVKVPSNSEFALSVDMKDGYNSKRRSYARCAVEQIAEVKESESTITMYEITVTVYPDASGVLYTELIGPNGS